MVRRDSKSIFESIALRNFSCANTNARLFNGAFSSPIISNIPRLTKPIIRVSTSNFAKSWSILKYSYSQASYETAAMRISNKSRFSSVSNEAMSTSMLTNSITISGKRSQAMPNSEMGSEGAMEDRIGTKMFCANICFINACNCSGEPLLFCNINRTNSSGGLAIPIACKKFSTSFSSKGRNSQDW